MTGALLIERPPARRRSERRSARPSPSLTTVCAGPPLSTRLRRTRWRFALPACWARMIRLAWSGSSSSVALAPVTTFLPFCSSTFWPMASTRTLERIVCARQDLDAARLGRLVVAREPDDVDAVVGQDEAAGGGIAAVVDLDRDRAHAARQDGRPPTSTRRWPTSPATWPSTRSTTAPSASSRSWTTAGTTAWPSGSSTTTRRTTTSSPS